MEWQKHVPLKQRQLLRRADRNVTARADFDEHEDPRLLGASTVPVLYLRQRKIQMKQPHVGGGRCRSPGARLTSPTVRALTFGGRDRPCTRIADRGNLDFECLREVNLSLVACIVRIVSVIWPIPWNRDLCPS